MTSLQHFKTRSTALLTSRGILPAIHDASGRFASDFIAYSWLYHSEFNDGDKMLDLLDNDENLNPGTCFDSNFRGNLKDLVVPSLLENNTFANLLNILVNNKAKGVGVGELVLPLLISGWRFSNESDGSHHGKKKELKMNGASLKPHNEETEKGLIDSLNKKYFGGAKPGLAKVHDIHVKYIKSLKKYEQINAYINYYTELYPGRDVNKLSMTLLENIETLQDYNTILGKAVMKWYQETDGWSSIIIIDPDTLEMVNVADIDSVNTDGGVQLVFRPVMSRGKDTQAVPDGYVNVSIAKEKTKRTANKMFNKLMEFEKSPDEVLAEQKEKEFEILADIKFIDTLKNNKDPLTIAWREVAKQVKSDELLDARDFIIEMIKDGVGNATIASTLVKSFC
jgi:hypothetical protein